MNELKEWLQERIKDCNSDVIWKFKNGCPPELLAPFQTELHTLQDVLDKIETIENSANVLSEP